jgi:hypothetical protein
VLARLDQIDGVKRSYTNRSGTLIRLSATPGTDPEAVAARAEAILTQEEEDRIAVRLSREAADEALAREEWRDRARVAELSAIELRTLLRLPVLLALGAGLLLAGLWLLWRRHRRRAGAVAGQ